MKGLTPDLLHFLSEWAGGGFFYDGESYGDGGRKVLYRLARFVEANGYDKQAYRKPLYRGLALAGNVEGMLESLLLDRNDIVLDPRPMESWSSSPDIAWNFVAGSVGEDKLGVMLRRKRANAGSVVVDMGCKTMWRNIRRYIDENEELLLEQYVGYEVREMRDAAQNADYECEVIVEQQCRRCGLDDVAGIFAYVADLDKDWNLQEWRSKLKTAGYRTEIKVLGRPAQGGFPVLVARPKGRKTIETTVIHAGSLHDVKWGKP